MSISDTSSIDHLVMREFVSGPPRYHLAIKGVREQFVILDQNGVSYVSPVYVGNTLHLQKEVCYISKKSCIQSSLHNKEAIFT